MSNIEYYVNNLKGVTVAVMTGCEDDAIDLLLKRGLMPEVNYYTPSEELAKYKMPKTFSGKATCSVDDNPDAGVGTALARARMLKKYYTSLAKRVKLRLKELEMMQKTAEAVSKKMQETADKWENIIATESFHPELSRKPFIIHEQDGNTKVIGYVGPDHELAVLNTIFDEEDIIPESWKKLEEKEKAEKAEESTQETTDEQV